MKFGPQALLANQAAPTNGAAITPSDTVDLPNAATKGIWVGGTGAIKVDMLDSGTVTFNAVPVGLLRIQVKRVWSTGTTATNLLALY